MTKTYKEVRVCIRKEVSGGVWIFTKDIPLKSVNNEGGITLKDAKKIGSEVWLHTIKIKRIK